MKRKQLAIICIGILYAFGACTTPKQASKAYLSIKGNKIQSAFYAKPDTSIDTKQLAELYSKYPERWNTAFKFLAELDTNNIKMGRTDLSKDVYVVFSEYETKDLAKGTYEAHKSYIDLHYVISGREQIAINKHISSLKPINSYNAQNDVTNYAYDGHPLLLADHTRYFICFPSDAHMPNIAVKKGERAKKLVIKIRYN